MNLGDVMCQHYRLVGAYGRKLTLFFAYFELEKSALDALSLFSVEWNSADSATSFQWSAKLIRSAKLYNFVCFASLLSCDLALGPGIIKDIPGYRSSGKIRVDSTNCTPGGGKKY